VSMSGEFIAWLVANGYCSGGGGEGCANGHFECDVAGCIIAAMWPLIEYEGVRAENARGQVINEMTYVNVECIRPQQEPYGPPFTVMVKKELKVPMIPGYREAYERERNEHYEITKLKARIQELERRHGNVIHMCNTTRDVDLDALPDQIIRVLWGGEA
jgi:hypothetical protein